MRIDQNWLYPQPGDCCAWFDVGKTQNSGDLSSRTSVVTATSISTDSIDVLHLHKDAGNAPPAWQPYSAPDAVSAYEVALSTQVAEVEPPNPDAPQATTGIRPLEVRPETINSVLDGRLPTGECQYLPTAKILGNGLDEELWGTLLSMTA